MRLLVVGKSVQQLEMKVADFKGLFATAVCAGGEAGKALQPVPMLVGSAKSLFGSEMDHSKPVYYVADGVCGFAWVNVRPGNSAFAKWLVKNDSGRKIESAYGECK